MDLLDIFSKRQKRARGEMPDLFVYDKLPQPLRVQIVHIITDAFGEDDYNNSAAKNAYKYVNDTLCREYGVFELGARSNLYQNSVFRFLLSEQSIERALDVVELCFQVINTYIRNNPTYRYQTKRKVESDDAIAELNARFREHGVGYQFESGGLVRVDSSFLHADAVKPALAVLRSKGFEGANAEFLNAHEHYRHGRTKECLVDALKSFESTIKVICNKRNWKVQPGDTAKSLIAVCFTNGLLPPFLESQFGSLRSLLETGMPTIRNKLGGHGQGIEVAVVPSYVASFALHLTASCILFLSEADATKT